MKTGTQQIAEAFRAKKVTLRFEGREQIVTIDDVEYRVPNTLHVPHIIAFIQNGGKPNERAS